MPCGKTYGSYDVLDGPAVREVPLKEKGDDQETDDSVNNECVHLQSKRTEWNCLQREVSPDAYHSMETVDGIQ